jgi:hypothetical protein
MKSMMFVLVPVICLWGCGDPGPVSQTDAGEDSAEDGSVVIPDSGSVESEAGFGAESGPLGCDCYTCPYGLGCRPGTLDEPPNPTTVHYPPSHTQM